MAESAIQKAPQPLSLLDCVTAGDYRWIEISANGQTDALRAGRGLRVFEHRRGRLLESERLTLTRLRLASGLEKLPGFLPFKPQEGVVYEDRYFFLKADSRDLVAHELSLPGSVSPLVQAIQDVARRLPEISPGSAQIIALPVEMLACLGEDAPRIDPGPAAPGASWTYLDRVLRNVGRSVAVPPADLAALETQVFRGTFLVRVRNGGKDNAVLLFRWKA